MILLMMTYGPDGILPGLNCITGDTVNITEWLYFAFYHLVWFYNDPNKGQKVG